MAIRSALLNAHITTRYLHHLISERTAIILPPVPSDDLDAQGRILTKLHQTIEWIRRKEPDNKMRELQGRISVAVGQTEKRGRKGRTKKEKEYQENTEQKNIYIRKRKKDWADKRGRESNKGIPKQDKSSSRPRKRKKIGTSEGRKINDNNNTRKGKIYKTKKHKPRISDG